MPECVIVLTDLYLSPRELSSSAAAGQPALPALAHAARFGERGSLTHGWRPWLARWLGRADLASLPVAQVAAASIGEPLGAPVGATRWIATPVELVAGLTRVHLDRRGIVRLTAAEQAEFAAAFERTFADAGLRLAALGDGQLLLSATGLAPVPTAEPARCAGAELAVPRGPAAAPLLRLLAEIEMWLHVEPLNTARRARGAAPVTGLWLWGAAGVTAAPANAPGTDGAPAIVTAAFGADAFLAGLCRLSGSASQALPVQTSTLFSVPPAERLALVLDLAAESAASEPWSLPAAMASLDRRVIAPAVAALRRGALGRLTLIANDVCITLGRHSGLKRWRRARGGLAAFA